MGSTAGFGLAQSTPTVANHMITMVVLWTASHTRMSERRTGSKDRRTRMKLQDQATYCLPDGTYTRAVQRAAGDAESE